MNKHTPGPWECDFSSSIRVYNAPAVINIGKKRLPMYLETDSRKLQEHDANAKLIAAAPDLLEALRYCVTMLENKGINGATLENAKTAIKKATE